MLLSGIRVLDLSRVLAGPLCTMLLGDLGADVLKVERPGEGDETRAWGPPFDERGESAYYLSINRNKLGLAADLDRPEDQALIRGLIADADVVVDNFRRGALARRGLDPATLLAAHPRLVWCTISGFGPDSDRPGYDFVLQAERGWMSLNGDPDGPPFRAPIAVTDVLTGKDAAIAVLGALVGRGGPRAPLPPGERHVQVSLAASGTAGLVNVAQNALVSGREPQRWGNAHANLAPYQLFDAADRAIVVAVGNDGQWRACAAALDVPELGRDPRFATNPARLANREALIAAMDARLQTRPAAEWLARLDAVGVPAGVVQTVLEALREVDASPLTGVAPSVPGSVRLPPPRLDEHGALVRARGWAAFAGGGAAA
ncbi:CaiB/BaiF CoA transferase family protein [Roseisolibacter agri]|uniref:CoA transferase n=1 Tax=Roseisolibacter agri TaxID=2014610 RepID=A0AA37QJR4_9BACT|nr:CoA transferase [Roseisolibacter agri]GLC27083.1 CoA transferase [Roseisolibacter agri]